MFQILKRSAFNLPERLVTPEGTYTKRREFLRQFGFAGGGLAVLGLGAQGWAAQPAGGGLKYPATRNPDFNPKWTLTDEKVAATYNNFYEFTTSKDRVHRLVGKFVTEPWPLEVTGLCENPMKMDAMEWASLHGVEERIYRFRCVEAWAMIVPWTGFQLSKLIEKAKPKPEAKFVKFVTFMKPDQAPGFLNMPQYPWPYTEGLRLDEAMHPLTIMATGIYGKPMPKQHGAPIRLVVPWKYGFKSGKSIVKIEFTAQQPKTLWESLAPEEYPFESNVDPGVPHPRWSQATERMIDSGDRVKTQLYNGYGSHVAKLYSKA
ncbi:MAG: protein-methionine-sulfoxide reductase catalytic subunit MsrP [Verrucomicrobia bacterium]|nr:protein-methionine-sulfoxide reductase catalytic subunit MsrP [Verrucomicrobiota bacterium]